MWVMWSPTHTITLHIQLALLHRRSYPCGHDMAYGKCECLSRNDIKFRSGTSNEWFKRQWTIVIIIASFCATATACEWLTKAFANWRHFCEQSIVAEGIEIEFDKKLISHTSGRIPALLLLLRLPCHVFFFHFKCYTNSVLFNRDEIASSSPLLLLLLLVDGELSRKQRYYIGKWWAKNIFHEMVWYGSLVVPRTSADKNSIVVVRRRKDEQAGSMAVEREWYYQMD